MIWPDGNAVEFEWLGTGTGSVVAGAAMVHRRLPPAANDGRTGAYHIRHTVLNEWELSVGSWAHGTSTMARGGGSILGSNGTSLVNFSAGPKVVAWVADTEAFQSLVPSYQPVTAAAAQAGYQITRGSAMVLVRLTEDLTAAATWAVPSSPVAGDRVLIFRQSGGAFDWANATLSLNLKCRGDGAILQYTGSSWTVDRLPGRSRARREAASRNLDIDDSGMTIAVTAAATFTLTDAIGQSTGFRVKLLQRGTSAATLALGGALVQVGSSLLQTIYDGDAVTVEAIGNSQVRVSHDPIEGDALATIGTSLTTSNTAGPPRRSTSTTPVSFLLDDVVPLGTYGTIIRGPGDISVTCAPDTVEYGQPGDDFDSLDPLLTDPFECLGTMIWALVRITPGGVRRYEIQGQTNLPYTDKTVLGTDTEGILPEAQGGTGATSVAANAAVAQAVSDSATALTAANGALSRSAGGTVTGATTFTGRLKTQEQVIGYVSRTPVSGAITVQQDDNGKVYIYGITLALTVPKTNTLVQVADEVFMAPIFNVSSSNNVTVTGALGSVVIGPKAYGLLMGLHGANMILVHQGVMTNIEAPT